MNRFSILIFLLYNPELYSQVLSGKVYYRQVLNLDKDQVNKQSHGKRAILYFTDTVSYYVYNSNGTASADTLNYTNEQGGVYDRVVLDNIGEVFMTNFHSRKIFMREFIWKNPFTATDTLTMISWTVTSEFKDIGQFLCQKANAFFHGRHFEAWFTEAIPVTAGPWKLQGLPGLILEAHDDRNEVQYIYDGIEIPSKEIFSFKIPASGKQVSIADFRNLWRDETEKIKKSLKASATKGTTIDVSLKYFPIETAYE